MVETGETQKENKTMDEIITTVTRDCVVAWKCPKCARYVARLSKCSGYASVPLGGGFSKDMRMDEIRKMLAPIIDKHVFRMDVAGDALPNKVGVEEITMSRSPYELVTCPCCECQPAWSEKSNGGPLAGWKMMLMPFVNLLGAVLGMIIGGAICMFLNLDDDLFGVAAILSAIAGAMGSMYLYSGAWKNRRAVKPTEKYHQPLAAFQKEIDVDEMDPRSAALDTYIKEHPTVLFDAKIESGIHVHADID